MRNLIRGFLDKPLAEQARISPKLAVAELLLEMARADYSAEASEVALVRDLLGRAYDLHVDELDALLKEAGDRLTRSISLYDTVAAVNAATDNAERKKLVGMLWRVAFADGKLDKYEEALLRKLCDLLFVAHSDFVREKLGAMDDGGVN